MLVKSAEVFEVFVKSIHRLTSPKPGFGFGKPGFIPSEAKARLIKA
jgi:hypothetical protein